MSSAQQQAPEQFSQKDLLEVVLLCSLGLSDLLEVLAPFEYLARRKEHLVVGPLPVSAVLQEIPTVVNLCQQLVTESSPNQKQAATRQAAAFMSQVLTILTTAQVQERLGGPQQVQPYIALLQGALRTLQQQQQQAGQQPAPAAAEPSDMGLKLSGLLAAISPFAQQATNSPFPRDFPALLTEWTRLVYGELADPSSIQVAPLLLYHWRTLLQYLQLCLLGAAAPGGAPPTLMPISTAISHVQGLLTLLQHDSLQALFKPHQYQRVVDRFAAFKTILQTLQQPAPGQPPAVHAFCSAVVAAMLDTAAPTQAGETEAQLAPAPSQVAQTEQQLVLRLIEQQLQAPGLTAKQLATVSQLLSVLKRQLAADDSSNVERAHDPSDGRPNA